MMSNAPNPIDALRAQVDVMLNTLNQDSPIGSTVVFQVRNDKETAFEQSAATLTTATRQLPGCKEFAFHKYIPIAPDPNPASAQHLIYEQWESVRLFRSQWDSAHLKQFQYGSLDMVAAPPSLNFYGGAEDSQFTRVFQTGQKRCWNANGEPISCTGSGQDGDIRAGLPSPSPRFNDNNDGTVTDNLTGLIWLKNANMFGEVAWTQALQNAAALGSGSLGLTDGSRPGDWRMPNVNEFQSILDLNNSDGAALPPTHPFINATPANYWSSSTVQAATPLGWYCALAVGPPVFDLKFNVMRMWPVRGKSMRIAKTGQMQCFDPMGQPIPCPGTGQDGELQNGVAWPDPRFTDNRNGTAKDNLTGLTWLLDAGHFGPLAWEDALAVCKALADGQGGLKDGSRPGDWRLPNLFELRSLIDYSQYSPALPSKHPFQNVRTSLYWSSTTVASAPNLARFVFVGIGPSVWDHKSVMLNVWPVSGSR